MTQLADALMSAALEFASRGIPVFPCAPGSKRPRFAGSFHNATTDPAVIRSWFVEGQRPPNIAFEPGAAGITIIDVDDKNGKRGSASWADIVREDGINPITLTVGTPSGGSHLYYRDEKGLRPSASKLGDGLDIRSLGGYALIPPSVLDEYGGAAYTWKSRADIEPISPTIAQRLAVKDTVAQESVVRAEDLDSDANVGRARAKLERLVAAGDVAISGNGGNDRTYRVLADVMAIGLSPERAVELVAEIWNPHCQPPWDLYGGDKDNPSLDVICRNAARYMQNAAGATGLTPGSELWPWEMVKPIIDTLHSATLKVLRERWRPMRPSEAIAMPAPEWWDDDKLFPKFTGGQTGMLFGPPARHKSGVLMSKLYAMWKKYGDAFRVVMAIGEDRDIIGHRLKAHMHANGMTVEELDRRLLLTAIPHVLVPEETLSIASWLRDYEMWRPSLFIVDTYATALQGADEDTRAGAVLTERGTLGELGRQLGTFPLVVHHTGHEGRKARGTSSFEGNVSVYASVGIDSDGKPEPENPEAVSLRVIKTKGARGGISAYYEIQSIGGAPVPTEVPEQLYILLTGKEHFDQIRITKALAALGAKERERGVSAFVLMQQLHPRPDEMDVEQWNSRLAKLANKLERRAHTQELAGFNDKQHGGGTSGLPLKWYNAG